jgi:L-seryl-tRNA(Ser) seleniumtransferase
MSEPSATVDRRRHLPSVDRLLAEPALVALAKAQGRALVVEAARAALSDVRARISRGEPAPDVPALIADVELRAAGQTAGTLTPVINATGIIVHTNLGRAPLSRAARAAMEAVAAGYSNLEYDLETGSRGSRYVHAEALLRKLTGAEAALVVNNNAAAILLALSALAKDREVVISRGQLVEIGGGFRVPDVLRQSGARLVEVGTTNRTHLRDFADAIDNDTALLLRVHSSNFKQIGFTTEVPLADMAALAHTRGIWLIDDLGSGTLLDTAPYGLASEPMAQESVAAGADLVTFSGDKLLGGPQAGLIVGRADLVERLRRHPLTRALRVDKATLAALQVTLLHYVRGEALGEIPVWRMISAPLDALERRAVALAASLAERDIAARVERMPGAVGGGSLPGETIASLGLAIGVPAPGAVSASLRAGRPPVVVRVAEGELRCDLRTVQPEEDATLLAALVAALESK